jgi:hypothetical protein
MIKHTPGPWVAECIGSNGDHENPQDIYEINGKTRVAEFVTEANARLIAAAPELLDALVTLLDAVEGKRITQGDCNQARAAIARATGDEE